MKNTIYRKIVNASFWGLWVTIIIWIILWASPRTPIGATGDWIPYKIRNQYIGNSLPHGSLPYEKFYGSNYSCSYNNCSSIRVQAPNNSDVVVIIKENDSVEKVVNHAYLKAGNFYTFNVPNGTYQIFFYLGKDWYPEKKMKDEIIGGFINNEVFLKDDPQTLNGGELSYSLVKKKFGNFHPDKSSGAEAL